MQHAPAILAALALKMICNGFFYKIGEKVVSSCLLQHKPICVINFDKLFRKKKFNGLLVKLFFRNHRHA